MLRFPTPACEFLTMTEPVPRTRRIPHWSWCLAATFLIAVVFAGVRFAVPIYQQQIVLRDLKTSGFRVRQSDAPKWLPSAWIEDDLRIVLSSNVVLVNVGFRDITDDDLPQLALLKNLGGLSLAPAKITDDGL